MGSLIVGSCEGELVLNSSDNPEDAGYMFIPEATEESAAWVNVPDIEDSWKAMLPMKVVMSVVLTKEV